MRTFVYVFILLFHSYILALNPIVIKGQKFFDSVTKEQFFIKGVAYQPSTTLDPLANPEACTRDAPWIQQLGANVIRVYQVDASQNHDACMATFADHGLYVVVGVSNKYAINRDHPEYNVNMYNAYRATVSVFSRYPHVLAFVAGNEVTNSTSTTRAASYVKAVVRDLKSSSRVPVGYASNDDPAIRDRIKDFLVCGKDTAVDFLGLNLYEWCSGATFESSGYAERTKELEAYGRPVFLSEYGCNTVEPRPFDEVQAIYGSPMTNVWSGGIVYEYTQDNNYGLVKMDTKVEPLADYHNLYKVLRMAEPKGIHMESYQAPEKAHPPCPPLSNDWEASPDLPPTPSEGACQCMMDNLSCVASNNANIGKQLDTMCGLVDCREISGKEKDDQKYGQFSFCNPDQKLSWLYDLYVTQTKHTANPVPCDFDGNAHPVIPKRNDMDTCGSIKPKTEISMASSRLSSLHLPFVFTFILYFI